MDSAPSTPSPTPAPFHTGLAVLLGRTNAGKSTLVNALVGSRVSIVTPKPQTTRHSVHGVVHRPHGQIVLVDTPGFFKTHRSALVDRLHARARAALEGIDVVLHVVDPSRAPGDEEQMVTDLLRTVSQPRLLCLTKSDLKKRPHLAAWRARAADYQAVIEVSAQSGAGLESLVAEVLSRLPAAAPLYETGQTTNASREFQIGEIIREKVYLLTGEEVPYRTAVRVDEDVTRVTEAGNQVDAITATILVALPRYKAMLIGARGGMVQKIRSAAASDLRRLSGRRVVLKLQVAVDDRSPD